MEIFYFYKNLNNIPKNIDLMIVCTNSDVRALVTGKLIKKKKY